MLWIISLVLFVAWVLASMKTSRVDGNLVENIHPYRRLMFYIMRQKNEATVYFDTYVDCEPLLRYIDEVSEKFPVDVTHCLVGAGFIGLSEVPEMNRFISGRRMYDRKTPEISFSMKRKRLNKEAKLANVKLGRKPEETFRGLCERINSKITAERSDTVTADDKEYNLFVLLPRPLLRGAIKALKTLDYFNLAPAALIAPDPLYTSIFCANLGSVGMAAGYHHLYEWGHCPLFMMVGELEDQPVVIDGEIKIRKTLHIRWSYDERIDDGLTAGNGIRSVKNALEHPYEYFGCLTDDGSDARPLDTPRLS